MCINIGTSLHFKTIWHFCGLSCENCDTIQSCPKTNKWHDVCTRNAELCDAGVLIFFLFVMCSFSCWLVIQSLGVSATSTMFWSLQSMWIKHMFQIFCFTTQRTTWSSSCWFVIVLCFRSKPKEAVSPRHVYRVRWHVCGWLWRKYSDINLGSNNIILYYIIVDTIVPLT